MRTRAGSSDIRRRAEEMLAALRQAEQGDALHHELRVHQVELEMQNEELRRAHAALEAARARYFNLFDRAPVGYITLSGRNRIRETNIRATILLGLGRHELVRQPLSRFIDPEDHDAFYRCHKTLFETGESQAGEFRMKRSTGGGFRAFVEMAEARDEATGAVISRITLSDITDVKRAEEERTRTSGIASSLRSSQ